MKPPRGAALVRCALGFGLLATVVAAQSPAFDVVSIKESTSTTGVGSANPEGTTRFVATNYPAFGLLMIAWAVPNGRVIGAPDWANRINYDIDARGDLARGNDDLRPRLQTLLRDRFKLAAHMEKRDLPVFELVRLRPDRLGPGLVKSPIIDCKDEAAIKAMTPPPRPCGWRPSLGAPIAGTLTMASIASLLSTAAARPVIDKTGLDGNYELDLKFSRGATDDAVSVFTAVQEQLGLKLENATAPVDVLVVEHMERPSAN